MCLIIDRAARLEIRTLVYCVLIGRAPGWTAESTFDFLALSAFHFQMQMRLQIVPCEKLKSGSVRTENNFRNVMTRPRVVIETDNFSRLPAST